MAAKSDLVALVEQFVSNLEAVFARQASASLAAKFDLVKQQLLAGTPVAKGPVVAKGRVGRPPGRRAAFTFEAKPCPVCGKPNRARGLSFLCEDHRSPEYIAKYKGSSKTAKAPSRAKRGPGRPRKVAPATTAAKVKAPEPAAAPKSSAPRTGASDEAMCRFPGCPNKHGGPRFHKFCREHFAKLSEAEREKYKAVWKAGHAA